ncbi:uncharacterized protein LOC135825574 isoform X2 [Sycon ciliatum]|uniref:uncharacterized protein LOC135825574 isoform X2 n=1 Tax=Sycon ciliatum TaxID=27933 RepID=UPI0020AC011E|eukprot:scpid23847/ scgid20974/ 
MTLPGMALVLIAISLTPAAGRMLQSPAEDAILPRSSVSARHSRAAVETLDRELINRNGNVPEMEGDGEEYPPTPPSVRNDHDDDDNNRKAIGPYLPDTRDTDDYSCVAPRRGLKIVEKDQCFAPCMRHCAEGLRAGFFHLSCLIPTCLPQTVMNKESPRGRESMSNENENEHAEDVEPWVFETDRYSVGLGEFPGNKYHNNHSASDLRPTNGFAMTIHPFTSWRRSMRFNLSAYRERGLAFDFFSAQIGLVTNDEEERVCSLESDRRENQNPDDTITFTIISNRGRLFTRNLKTRTDAKLKVNFAIHLPENVRTLRLHVYRQKRHFRLSPFCAPRIYAVWSQASLSNGRPILPACGKECRIDGKGVYLSCLLGGCSGTALKYKEPGHYAVIEKLHNRSQICIDCSIRKRRHLPTYMDGLGRLEHFIGAHADSRVAFDLGEIRHLVADETSLNVFHVTVGLSSRSQRKCLSRLRTPAQKRLYRPMTFNILLDNDIAQTVELDVFNQPSRNLSILISRARRTLRIEALGGTGSRLCNQAIWANPRLEHSTLYAFPPCNRDCESDFERGHYPLSCTLGKSACPGSSVWNSSLYAQVGPISWGVGIDTAGDWAISWHRASFRRRIQFSGGRRPFKRGIGLHAPGTVEFNLGRMRESGLKFNFLHVVVGMDTNSLLPRCTAFALMVGGEARVYGDGRLLGSWVMAHQHSARSRQSSLNPKQTYGSGHDVYISVNGVDKLRFVARNPTNSLCGHVAFGLAELITLDSY